MKYNLNLRTIRENNNFNQEKIAELLGITRTVYTKYENGYELIPIKHLISFANYFNVSIDYIFNFVKNEEKRMYSKNLSLELVGIRLKEFRKDNTLTQDKLAGLLNTNKSVICNYERGRYLIATPFLYTICFKYHVSADYLLGRVNEPKYI